MVYPVVPQVPPLGGNKSLVMQNAATGTANGTDFNVEGYATVILLVAPDASYTGTVSFKASPDGTTFTAIQGAKQLDATIASSVVCSGGTASIWAFQVAGSQSFRASIAGDNTNKVTVTGFASNEPNLTPLAATITSTVLGAGSNLVGGVEIYDGSGVNKLAVDADGAASVNLDSIAGTDLTLGHGVAAGGLLVELPTDGTGKVGLNAGTNVIGGVIPTSGTKATYSYSASALGAQAAHTDMMVLRGSASKVVKIIHFECSGDASAATGIVWFLKKHTVANTGGSGTSNPTATQHDSADGAATAVVNTYQTTLPTIDASATLIRSIRLDLVVAPAAQAYATDRYIEDFGINGGEPIVLRGVAQEFALNLGGGTIPTGEVVDFSITWTEE